MLMRILGSIISLCVLFLSPLLKPKSTYAKENETGLTQTDTLPHLPPYHPAPGGLEGLRSAQHLAPRAHVRVLRRGLRILGDHCVDGVFAARSRDRG